MEPIIQVNKLYKYYKIGDESICALQNVNLEIFSGEFIAIVGPSGSGKSTLMNIIGCIDKPSSGEVVINGKSVINLDDNNLSLLRNNTLSFIFQSFNLIQNLTAIENVELPLVYRREPKEKRSKLAYDALLTVGLEQRANHKPNEMSGGQQQRVAIARAIAQSSPIILADEPTGNLDSINSASIMEILRGLCDKGKTVLLITHDHNIAEKANRIIEIHDGVAYERRN